MSIKLKEKYDYISTSDGTIIPLSSIISIEKDNSSGYSNRMYNTYKIYYIYSFNFFYIYKTL